MVLIGHVDKIKAQELPDELARLLASNPQIRAAEKNIEAADQAIRRARAGYLPRLSITGDAGYEVVDSPSRRAVQGDAMSGSRENAFATLTQNLFEGFRTVGNKATAELGEDIAELSLELTRQNLTLQGITAYLDTMRQLELIELARANEATIKRQMELEDERVEQGGGITLDVLFAKSRLQIAKERRVAFQGGLKEAVNRYQQTYGHRPVLAEMIVPEASAELLPATRDVAVEVGRAENLTLVNSELLIDVADERRRIARADFYPRVDLEARGNIEDDVDGTAGLRRDWSVVVRATWELFSGFETQANVAEASSFYGASLDNKSDATRQVVRQVETAWDALETNRERVGLLQNAVNIAAEVFASRRQLREAGKETAINVLDAESEVFNAKTNLVSATFDRRLAVYRLLFAMGRLTAGILGVSEPVTDN